MPLHDSSAAGKGAGRPRRNGPLLDPSPCSLGVARPGNQNFFAGSSAAFADGSCAGRNRVALGLILAQTSPNFDSHVDLIL